MRPELLGTVIAGASGLLIVWVCWMAVSVRVAGQNDSEGAS